MVNTIATLLDPFDFFFMNDSYWFNRPIKDMKPWTYEVKDGKGLLTLNTLGVSPDDISVEVKPGTNVDEQYLKIAGKTKRGERDYSVNMNFSSTHKIHAVDWSSVDGVTELSIEYEKPAEPKVVISRVTA